MTVSCLNDKTELAKNDIYSKKWKMETLENVGLLWIIYSWKYVQLR